MVTENGRRRKLTKQQVIVKALAAKAAKGDTRAIAKIVDLILTLFGADGDQVSTRTLTADDQAILDGFIAQIGTGEGGGNG